MSTNNGKTRSTMTEVKESVSARLSRLETGQSLLMTGKNHVETQSLIQVLPTNFASLSSMIMIKQLLISSTWKVFSYFIIGGCFEKKLAVHLMNCFGVTYHQRCQLKTLPKYSQRSLSFTIIGESTELRMIALPLIL